MVVYCQPPLTSGYFVLANTPPTHNQRYKKTPGVFLTFIGNLTGISQECVTYE